MWSEPYADFDTGASYISPAVLLKNQASELVGVAAGDVVLTTVALILEDAAKESGASAIYVMDSSKKKLAHPLQHPGDRLRRGGSPSASADVGQRGHQGICGAGESIRTRWKGLRR